MTPQENMEQLLYYLTLATKNEDDNPPQQQQDPATLPSTASSSSSLGTSSIVDQLLIQQNFTNVNLTLNQQQQLHVNNNHNSVSTNTIVMNGGQPGMANANPIELVPSGNNNSNCSVGYPTATMINMNFNNTYMGMPPQLIINPTQPVDQFTYSPNSTPSSSSSSASHDSAPQMLQTVHKKKKNSNKINKQRKMNREMISTGYNSSSVYHVGSSSSIASSSTDSPTTSSSSNMQFIHTSKEEMRIKYDSESSLNSTVAPKRKRGRPKKQEPTRPAKLDYEFIQEKGTGDSKTKK